MIFYLYRSFTGNKVTVNEAFQQANRRLWPLFLVFSKSALIVSAGFFVLIIPGVYLGCRLLFAPFATVIDNCSGLDSFDSTFQLTQGREWLVFRASFLIVLVVFLPIILISRLIDPTGKSVGYQLTSNLLEFLAGPLMDVYFVLLYLRLRESPATIE